MTSGYRVIHVAITVDMADGETYEQAVERISAALDTACPEGWRGVLTESLEPVAEAFEPVDDGGVQP